MEREAKMEHAGLLPQPESDDPESVEFFKIYVSEQRLAAYLRLHPNTLRSWRTHGVGPHHLKLGTGIYYRRSELWRWLALADTPPARRCRQSLNAPKV
jgi:hypothetical protein